MYRHINAASWALRIGLAFVLAYAAVETVVNPNAFLEYIPSFVSAILPAKIFLPLFGIGEVILVIWLLIGWRVRYPAILTALLMLGIVVFNLDYFNVLFRNIAIGGAALALAFLAGAQEGRAKASGEF